MALEIKSPYCSRKNAVLKPGCFGGQGPVAPPRGLRFFCRYETSLRKRDGNFMSARAAEDLISRETARPVWSY